jgi:hypothetical protein
MVSTAVILHSHPEDTGTLVALLSVAIQEPPSDPEAHIVDRDGRLLAEADPDRVRWVLTANGRARVEAEVRNDRDERRQEIRDEIADEERDEAHARWAEGWR